MTRKACEEGAARRQQKRVFKEKEKRRNETKR